MHLSGTDPESYITENTSVYEDYTNLVTERGIPAATFCCFAESVYLPVVCVRAVLQSV